MKIKFDRNQDFQLDAKVLEQADAVVYSWGGVMSGHALKHFAAAMAGVWVLRALVRGQGGWASKDANSNSRTGILPVFRRVGQASCLSLIDKCASWKLTLRYKRAGRPFYYRPFADR